MKNALAILALAGSTAASQAAGNAIFLMVPRATSIGGGESVIIDMYIDKSGVTGALCVAGFKFDVLGHDHGTLSGLVDTTPVFGFEHGVNNGTSSGPNLHDFSGGRLPPNHSGQFWDPERIGSVTFTDGGEATENYTVTLSIVDYISPAGGLSVFIGASGTQSRSGLTSTTGTHTVTFEIGSFEVVVPAPASAALLTAAGLAFGRRRR